MASYFVEYRNNGWTPWRRCSTVNPKHPAAQPFSTRAAAKAEADQLPQETRIVKGTN